MRLTVVASVLCLVPLPAVAVEPTVTLTQSELAARLQHVIEPKVTLTEAEIDLLTKQAEAEKAAAPVMDKVRKAFAPPPPAVATKPK